MSSQLPESLDGLPNFCGAEPQVELVIQSSRGKPVFLPQSGIDRTLRPVETPVRISTRRCSNRELPPTSNAYPLFHFLGSPSSDFRSGQ